LFIDGFAGKLYQRHLKKDGITRIVAQNTSTSKFINWASKEGETVEAVTPSMVEKIIIRNMRS
jgi:hypothetical protein